MNPAPTQPQPSSFLCIVTWLHCQSAFVGLIQVLGFLIREAGPVLLETILISIRDQTQMEPFSLTHHLNVREMVSRAFRVPFAASAAEHKNPDWFLKTLASISSSTSLALNSSFSRDTNGRTSPFLLSSPPLFHLVASQKRISQ